MESFLLTSQGHKVGDHRRDSASQPRRHSVPNLGVLLCPISGKEVVIRECLKPCSFTNRKAPAL